MAVTIPESIRSTATAGERLFFRTLKTYLPDDYIVYFEPEIQGKRPDFVIIGPDLGIVVLEVKDYTKNTLFQINHDEWHIVSASGEQSVIKSPMKQARDYTFQLVDVLKKDKNLIQLEGKYKFNLKFPYGHGVIFTRMTSQDFIKNDLYTVIEPSLCFTRDEIDPDKDEFSEEILLEKILNMFVVPFRLKEPLSMEDINAIKESNLSEIIDKIERRETILPTYDAVLIDEGQDFEADWLRLVSLLINADTQSLLLVEDRAQTIYKRKRSYLQDTGLSFQGRSKVLTINYRNTSQIVKFAWDFYRKHSVFKNKVVNRELDGEIIAPQSTKRKGPEPGIIKAANFFDEMRLVSRQIKKLHEERKVPFEEILILYRVKRTHKYPIIDLIKRSLVESMIPFYWITENDVSKRTFKKDDGKVKISTVDSSKGLDFQAVFIVNVDSMPFPLEEDKEREVSLLYIGMTRAKQYLCLSYSSESEFTNYLDSKLLERKQLKGGIEKVN
ncbi:NERD domain-containing protein [Neobacillus cucumis]|uniref:nuclease-related domain-containing DEAD/DEAH box helicase n=1 Tax=Neobacillus cucumis TaxID=1740721 RepID=UPI002042195A|nr:3'-5' exonuclease [Neobacillus cucumis]MCM3727847.1 NERD domain-containing protein [Neobacillus cucumis]